MRSPCGLHDGRIGRVLPVHPPVAALVLITPPPQVADRLQLGDGGLYGLPGLPGRLVGQALDGDLPDRRQAQQVAEQPTRSVRQPRVPQDAVRDDLVPVDSGQTSGVDDAHRVPLPGASCRVVVAVDLATAYPRHDALSLCRPSPHLPRIRGWGGVLLLVTLCAGVLGAWVARR